MKKRFRKLLATLGIGTCVATNINGCVYGPPPITDDGPPKTVQPSEKTNNDDKNIFSPEDNIPEDVYGPPPYWGNPDEEEQ